MKRVWLAAAGLGLALAAGCGTTPPGSGTPSAPSTPTTPPQATPNADEPVFAYAELVWAQGSVIHVDQTRFELPGETVDWLAWSPSRLCFGTRVGEAYRVSSFDGTTRTDLGSVDGRVVTSPDGALAAWIDRDGPERPAGRAAQLVVQDTATGKIVYRTSEGMGGEEGDDLGDRYEELPPSVTAIRGDSVFWTDAEGGGWHVVTDVTSGSSQRGETDWPVPLTLTAGHEYSSPDGRFRVDASETGKLRVSPHQPDFGGEFQTQAGWIGDHTLVAVVQDQFEWAWDPTVPDQTPGRIVACDLAAGTCATLIDVVGVRDLVFAGAPEQ